MDNFAVMFERATREPEEGTEWVEKMEDFITHLLEEGRVNTAIEVQEGWTEELKKNFEAGAAARDKELVKKIKQYANDFIHAELCAVKNPEEYRKCGRCVIEDILHLITNSKE